MHDHSQKNDLNAPKISDQALNKKIKEVCKLAGIDTVISHEKNIAGQNLSKEVPKYELISSNIAGKTFITLAKPKWGLDPEDIAAIVGKDLRTLLTHYFQLQRDDAKKQMMEAASKSQNSQQEVTNRAKKIAKRMIGSFNINPKNVGL